MKRLSEDDINLLICKQLKKLRGYKGASQGQFGAAIGVSNQQYSKFETGKNRIFAGQLYLLAQEYDVDINSFFYDCEFDK
ncbi:XRE family transcriptional regulator [Pseudoalteromonas sp. CO342X]|uniref:helix-turn-helix domain-containing protein n=1 Tax=Pseudoalteromonas sp. CO342X TaxID=1777270 RepID=UPI0010238CD8|nr:helix-turn-helix transcriptional regulator [Pseudoalteromonas sp. CO342X]RZG16731.1 XRE family transcriptional regulator [Pseudoalteromonas sp. CO342X]